MNKTPPALASLVAATALALGILQAPPAAQADEIQFGKVVVENSYGCTVTVRLYHADALDRVFNSWTLDSHERYVLTIDNREFTIGGDWVIDVQFGEHASQRRLVYKVGTHSPGQWTIKTAAIYRGKR